MSNRTLAHPRIQKLLEGHGPLPQNSHAGLVWDRYFPIWTGTLTHPAHDKTGNPLGEFVDRFNARATDPAWKAIVEAREHRQGRAIAHWSGSGLVSFEAWTTGQLAIGLGASHPTENGFLFDPNLGLPYIPGSSLKGLTRRVAELFQEGDSSQRLLGSRPPERDTRRSEGPQPGDIVFHDAYPTRWPNLGVDVIVCHYPTFYRALSRPRPQNAPPEAVREIDSPIPVTILCIEGGASFRMHVSSRSHNQADADTVAGWLKEGLKHMGVGAKTAVGYGSFDFSPPRDPKLASIEDALAAYRPADRDTLTEKIRGIPDKKLRNRLMELLVAKVKEVEGGSAAGRVRRRIQEQ